MIVSNMNLTIKAILHSFKLDTLIKPKSNAFVCEAVCVLAFLPAINFFLNQILQTYFSFSSISSIFYLFMAAIGLAAYTWYFSKSQSIIVITAILILLLTFISYSIYPEISTEIINNEINPLTNTILGLFCYQIPAMIYASNIKKWDVLMSRMYVYSIFTLFLGIVSFYYFTFKTNSEDIPNYMVYSYNLLTGLGPLVVFSFLNKNLFDIILVFIGAVCMLINGARGAQVAFVLIIFCCMLFLSTLNKYQTVFLLTLTFILLVTFISNPKGVSDALDNVLGDYNIHSRTLMKLLEGDAMSQSGRDIIREDIIVGITNNPFGYGLFGDRYLTAIGSWGTPTYCHNFFFEICCDFGILIGPIIILYLFISISRLLRDKQNPHKANVMLMLLPCGIFQLLFSGSFIVNITFFLVIGSIFNDKKSNILSY